MDEGPYWPRAGLPLAEWLAALHAIEPILQKVHPVFGQIDGRVLEAEVHKDETVRVRTGEVRGAKAGRGHLLRLRKGEDGWAVVEVAMWKI